MFIELGAIAVVATVMISANNPRAIFWIALGSFKILLCSLYVHFVPSGHNFDLPDGAFISLILTGVFCQLLDKFRVFEWELVLLRLVLLSLAISAAKFLSIPVLSQFYGPLNAVLYSASLVLIFVNSLLKARLLNGDFTRKLNRFLKAIGCNSRQLEKKRGWVERWY